MPNTNTWILQDILPFSLCPSLDEFISNLSKPIDIFTIRIKSETEKPDAVWKGKQKQVGLSKVYDAKLPTRMTERTEENINKTIFSKLKLADK